MYGTSIDCDREDPEDSDFFSNYQNSAAESEDSLRLLLQSQFLVTSFQNLLASSFTFKHLKKSEFLNCSRFFMSFF